MNVSGGARGTSGAPQEGGGAAPAHPLLALPVVVGTENHLFLDAAAGAACVALGVAAALLIHGRPRAGRPDAGPAGIARAGLTWGALALAAHVALLVLPT